MTAYPLVLVPWRCPKGRTTPVLLHPSLALALDALDLPDEVRPTGSRSGARTRHDMATLYPSDPARLSDHEWGGAVDLSPSVLLTDTQVGSLNPAMAWIYGSASGHLWRPVKGEAWHVQLRDTRWPGPSPSAVRVTCGVAEFGPGWWAASGHAASDWKRAAVTLAQGYLARLGLLRWSGVDGLLGPVTRGAIEGICPTWAPVGSTIEEIVLCALAEACAERGV